MGSIFVIPCYFNIENPVIFNCINSIQKFHPNSNIVVIDSGSSDKSYFSFLKEKNVTIEDVNNRNYDTGAYWYAFKKYKNKYSLFYFIHDSVKLNKKLPVEGEGRFFSIRYFYSHDKLHELYTLKSIKNFILDSFLSKLNFKKKFPEMYGFDSITQKKWVEGKLKNLDVCLPIFFLGLFGPMMIIDKELMNILEDAGLDKILPANKEEQKAMERIFGIVLASKGIDIINHSLQGDHMKPLNLDSSFLSKKILNRK